ncbi:hypothetical protein DFA_08254 [Cavenderia fasciculata]|uniref:Uncharacterized protein n=1 Tax=Cavenderia fasciculata TaxID=261658 RepID=F4Q5K4_CACFS|nr:uncharacterized protein DFA_08254 [Cavenderia fasciculata]EGG17263.1 hypothetical protein DFA_08254 [Cavenderia fasciculata]|eukprot:XP_004355747.1 hypothetical protein DFA_08254 [Cavenderia fasciculata]
MILECFKNLSNHGKNNLSILNQTFNTTMMDIDSNMNMNIVCKKKTTDHFHPINDRTGRRM